MSQQKRRLQIPDLNSLPAVTPAGAPVDAYVRPGSPEIGKPEKSNPITKLSESLAAFNSDLQPVMQQMSQQLTKEEEAKLVADFQLNRDKWNTAVRNGEVPLGASPHAARAVKRLMLSELADDFTSRTSLAFSGEAGTLARESNDPRVMRQFLDQQSQAFYAEHLRNGERELYSPLDIQEAWTPKIEKANSDLMRAHAQYRVQENERELIDTVGASVSRTVDDVFDGLTATTPEAERNTKLQGAAQRIADTLYHPDHGAIRNGLHTKRGGDLLVDTIVTRAIARGDRSVLEVINHIRRPDGPPLAIVPDVQRKILQAEEHLTSLQIQQERHAWALEDRPYEVASREHQQGEWKKQDERWLREVESWKQQDASRADHEIMRSLTRRLYEGLRRPDSKAGVSIINDAIRQAETVIPEQAERLREIVHTMTQRRLEVVDDPLTVAQMRARISKDPLSVRPDDLVKLVKQQQISVKTMMGLQDDLDRTQAHADHPLMRQSEVTEMLHQVQRGALQSPSDEFSAEGQLRVANATASFRDKAAAWIEQHPQGGMAQFRDYLRSQVEPIIETANREYGRGQEAERQKEVSKGKTIVDRTSQAVAADESKQRAAAELQRLQQEKAQRLKAELDDFRPTGKKTREGRPVLQNSKGDIMTERTITIRGHADINSGGLTNIPTIFGGKVVSDEEAIRIIAANKGVDPETGKPLRRYWSVREAEIAARERSARLGRESTPQRSNHNI